MAKERRAQAWGTEELTVKSGSRSFDGLRLWWYNCNDDLRKQRMSDAGRGGGREGRERRDGREREETDKLGCELTRTGPGCKRLFVLVWMVLGGCSRWPCTSLFPPLWLRTISLQLFCLRRCPFFSHENQSGLDQLVAVGLVRTPHVFTSSSGVWRLASSTSPARRPIRSRRVLLHDDTTTKHGDQAILPRFPYSWHDARLLSDQSGSLRAFSLRAFSVRSTTHK